MGITASLTIPLLTCAASLARPSSVQQYEDTLPPTSTVARYFEAPAKNANDVRRSLQTTVGGGSGGPTVEEKKAAAEERKRKRVEERRRKRRERKKAKAKRLRKKKRKEEADAEAKAKAELDGREGGDEVVQPGSGVQNAIPGGKCISLLGYVRLDEICCNLEDCEEESDCSGPPESHLCIPYEDECESYFYVWKCTPSQTRLSTYEVNNVLATCSDDSDCDLSGKREKCVKHERPRENQRSCPAKGITHNQLSKERNESGNEDKIVPTER